MLEYKSGVCILQLPPLARLEALQQLEVSYNEIRSIVALKSLPSDSLVELYAACNKITQIQVS
jgi:Leucine-rich repeat (LRR) protein